LCNGTSGCATQGGMYGWLADHEQAGSAMKSAAIALLALLMSCAHADGLGRLFFTPVQRAQLDGEEEQKTPAEKEHHAFILMLNGIVQRSDGVRTVWVNGAAQNLDDGTERAPDTHAIAAPGESQPAEIKVGQKLVLDRSAGE
jgi:hypothetical protein